MGRTEGETRGWDKRGEVGRECVEDRVGDIEVGIWGEVGCGEGGGEVG